MEQAIGNRGPIANAYHFSVVAIRAGGNDHLYQFSETCAPEEATSDLPYISIGSGQQNADPFLAFLRRVFWEGKTPNLSDGIFATLWALTQTIKSSPSSVSEPITIAVLKDEELEEHRQAITEAENTLRGFRTELEAR